MPKRRTTWAVRPAAQISKTLSTVRSDHGPSPHELPEGAHYRTVLQNLRDRPPRPQDHGVPLTLRDLKSRGVCIGDELAFRVAGPRPLEKVASILGADVSPRWGEICVEDVLVVFGP